MEIDALDLAIDACFSQSYEGMWHPVAYYSRKLSPAKQNYDIHDKELLAIVAALEAWRVYIEGAPGLNKFKILYTLGKENGRADALSRRSDHMETKESFNHSILKVNNDESLSTNKHELNATLRILRDESKEFSIEKGKLQISTNKIDECIKEHHDESLQGHLGVTKTL